MPWDNTSFWCVDDSSGRFSIHCWTHHKPDPSTNVPCNRRYFCSDSSPFPPGGSMKSCRWKLTMSDIILGHFVTQLFELSPAHSKSLRPMMGHKCQWRTTEQNCSVPVSQFVLFDMSLVISGLCPYFNQQSCAMFFNAFIWCENVNGLIITWARYMLLSVSTRGQHIKDSGGNEHCWPQMYPVVQEPICIRTCIPSAMREMYPVLLWKPWPNLRR